MKTLITALCLFAGLTCFGQTLEYQYNPDNNTTTGKLENTAAGNFVSVKKVRKGATKEKESIQYVTTVNRTAGSGSFTTIKKQTSQNKEEKKESTKNGFAKVYPNPTEGGVTFEYWIQSKGGADLIIYNLVGAVMQQHRIKTGHHTFQVNMENLPNGIYLYQITSAEGMEASGKVVLRK